MKWIRPLLLGLLVAISLSAIAEATQPGCPDKLLGRRRRLYNTNGCGPLWYGWHLPVGNGHYWQPNKCIGPAYLYSPSPAIIPPAYHGPRLRTINEPMVDENSPPQP